jgi:hypothetical protein
MSSSQAAIAGKAALPLFLPSDSALDRTRQNRLYGRLRAQDVAAPAAQIGGSRASALTSDRHAGRLVLQRVNEPNADSARLRGAESG